MTLRIAALGAVPILLASFLTEPALTGQTRPGRTVIPHPVFNGTTHMMMIGTNNLEVADVILNWAGANIPSKARSQKKGH